MKEKSPVGQRVPCLLENTVAFDLRFRLNFRTLHLSIVFAVVSVICASLLLMWWGLARKSICAATPVSQSPCPETAAIEWCFPQENATVYRCSKQLHQLRNRSSGAYE